MSASLSKQGSTLAEVIVGMLVLTIVMLAVLGILIQSGKLDESDTEQTEVLAITQGLLEQRIDRARTLSDFNQIESTDLKTTADPELLYRQDVTELALGLKKVSITTYYADPTHPTAADTSRPKGGEALTLSVTLSRPIR